MIAAESAVDGAPGLKKNRMPWTSSICECSATYNCQRSRNHLSENFILNVSFVVMNFEWFAFEPLPFYNFRIYLLIVIYYLQLQLLPIFHSVHRSTLYVPKSVKGPWRFQSIVKLLFYRLISILL